ncbi:MAG: hypothetical protein LBD33_02210 [Puniceicoccales bacterium]|jgi:hypothetical protein|nr:hypothetical protein [Puniceicoccales bacterium]
MLRKFLTLLLAACSANLVSGEPLSNFGVVNKKFGKAKILNKNVKCFRLAEKGEFCGGVGGKCQFSKSRRYRGKITEIHANQK